MPRKKTEKLTPDQLYEQAKKTIEDAIKIMEDEQAKQIAINALGTMKNAIVWEKAKNNNKCNKCPYTNDCHFSLKFSAFPQNSKEYHYCPKEKHNPRLALSKARLQDLGLVYLN